MFSAIITRENCFLDILFTFPEVEARPKELYSYNIEFALAIEPNGKRGKIEAGRVAPPPHLNM